MKKKKTSNKIKKRIITFSESAITNCSAIQFRSHQRFSTQITPVVWERVEAGENENGQQCLCIGDWLDYVCVILHACGRNYANLSSVNLKDILKTKMKRRSSNNEGENAPAGVWCYVWGEKCYHVALVFFSFFFLVGCCFYLTTVCLRTVNTVPISYWWCHTNVFGGISPLAFYNWASRFLDSKVRYVGSAVAALQFPQLFPALLKRGSKAF